MYDQYPRCMNMKQSVLVERVKQLIEELVHERKEPLDVNVSHYLGEKMQYDYGYLATLFSKEQGISVEHYMIQRKTERAKLMLTAGELSVTEIAAKLHYSSVAHLSNQFKKMTGMAPTRYRKLYVKKRDENA